jgi:hypothetical protein
MRTTLLLHSPAALLCLALVLPAEGKPFSNGRFQGRVAYSGDGNHNDPDDWIASPLTLAILAEAGLKDRLVHFHYNSILPLTDPQWEKTHAESVLGAAERYGFDRTLFFNCREDLDGAVGHLVKAINDSSAGNPLYFIIAGPMEVPVRALRNSDPAKRQHVYCISHSAWNDGYGRNYQFGFTKRSVIEQGVRWVQLRDQNAKLSFGKYGRPSPPGEFAPYFWMRDSTDPKVRFLWERMVVSTRPDPSDAGMTWFLVTGDEECDPGKLKRLIQEHRVPTPLSARSSVRLEAENFRELKDAVVESINDRAASHRLNVRVSEGKTAASLGTCFDEPFTLENARSGAGTARPRSLRNVRYDLEVRYFDQAPSPVRFSVFLDGKPQGAAWQTSGAGKGWATKLIPDVPLRTGQEIRIEMEGADARVDYVQLQRPDSISARPGK